MAAKIDENRTPRGRRNINLETTKIESKLNATMKNSAKKPAVDDETLEIVVV